MTNTSIYNYRNDLTFEYVRSILDYDQNTGIFTWKPRENNISFNKQYMGRPAGSPLRQGYIVIRINNKQYYAHRLAWLCVHGRWPDNIIDHKNRIRSDNRIENLRDCSHAENAENAKKKEWSSGIEGVYFRKSRNKWVAMGIIDGKKIKFGSFKTKEEAEICRINAMKNIFPSKTKNKCVEKTIIQKEKLSHEILLKTMFYNEETGNWFRKKNGLLVLVEAMPIDSGYIRFKVFSKSYMSHVLAWFYMTGEWPKQIIDHIDRNSANNKWSNLREVNRSKNSMNSISTKTRGIRRHKNKWRADIRYEGKTKHLGVFECPLEAMKAYDTAYFEYMREPTPERVVEI